MFWKNFISLCANKGVSPNAVAAELHLSSGSVTAWKGGTVPRETTLKKIAAYFNVSVDSLIGFNAQKNIAAPQGDDLSPLEAELMNYVRALSEEQKRFLLAQMQTLKEQGSAAADSQ